MTYVSHKAKIKQIRTWLNKMDHLQQFAYNKVNDQLNEAMGHLDNAKEARRNPRRAEAEGYDIDDALSAAQVHIGQALIELGKLMK